MIRQHEAALEWREPGGITFTNLLLDKQIVTIETCTTLLLVAVADAMPTAPVSTPMPAKMKAVPVRSS